MRTAQRVLVPVALHSAESAAAVELAATLVKASGGELTLLHVLAPTGSLSGLVPGARDEVDLEPTRQQALKVLQQLAATVRAEGIARVSTNVEIGHPIERILDHARIHAVELIVMGTHGRQGLSRLLMGSVAELVLRQATCRVVIVRDPSPTPDPRE